MVNTANGLEDKVLLCSHFYLMLETWFVSPVGREYFGIKSTTFLSTNLQKIPLGKMNC